MQKQTIWTRYTCFNRDQAQFPQLVSLYAAKRADSFLYRLAGLGRANKYSFMLGLRSKFVKF
jgi:hypothetical protein